MGKTRISVQMNEQDAEQISREFSMNGIYLRSLIDKYVPVGTRKSVYEMDYTELKHYGYVIRGVAIKILNDKTNQLEKKAGAEQLILL